MATDKYPITLEDFDAMHARIASGSDMTIPVRSGWDINGTEVNMLTWGHPKAYELFGRDGEVFSRLVWEGPCEHQFDADGFCDKCGLNTAEASKK